MLTKKWFGYTTTPNSYIICFQFIWSSSNDLFHFQEENNDSNDEGKEEMNEEEGQGDDKADSNG